ncbi:MAG TPA: alkaline phosphatase family protein [Candidatus Kapabacteria bacterium]|nr:alkaline phosphatase family protein [Candidatus Kapabacteria bacterium]
MTPAITNVVVVMFENRSYDNVLGMLYNSSYPAPYNQAPSGQADLQGLSGSESNPNPNGNPITVAPAVNNPNAKPPVLATAIPTADPGEPFMDMAQQILGLENRPTDGNPYAAGAGTYGMMGGFVANYLLQGNNPVPEEIMMYMTPELMPVTAFLANNYMVCDEWFGSIPTQTFANRLYSLCADSGTWATDLFDHTYSYINDSEYLGVPSTDPLYKAKAVYNDKPPALTAPSQMLDLPSVFAQLDAVLGVTQQSGSGPDFPSWKVYFHDYSLTANLLQYVKTQFLSSTSLNIGQYDNSDYTSSTTHLANRNFTTFAEDLAAGTLASFTLIEPRYSNNYSGAATGNQGNSNHPGLQGYPPLTAGTGQIDTYYGELLLLDIYTQLRNSSYWPGTLLIVTYDEHGGCYDHVPPVMGMVPPSPSTPNTFTGFDFTVSGPRVPTLVISPFAQAGSALRAPSGSTFDHTSIIRTLWDCFNLGCNGTVSITARDAAAASIVPALSSSAVNSTGVPPTPSHP